MTVIRTYRQALNELEVLTKQQAGDWRWLVARAIQSRIEDVPEPCTRWDWTLVQMHGVGKMKYHAIKQEWPDLNNFVSDEITDDDNLYLLPADALRKIQRQLCRNS